MSEKLKCEIARDLLPLYIDWCLENGIVEGVGDGFDKSDREIIRQEMAAIRYRFAADYDKAQLTYPDMSSIFS